MPGSQGPSPSDHGRASVGRIDVALSFDNGPEPAVTPLVLDILRRHRLRATFFVLGHKLASPGGLALAEAAHADGNWILNHTWSHAAPLGTQPNDAALAAREIGATQDLIGALSHPDRLFRPQGGGGRLGPHLLSEAARAELARRRMTCVLWDLVPGDFADPEGWAGRALAALRDADGPRTLVLHDLPNGAMRHLDAFLDRAQTAGCRFVQDFPRHCVPMRRGIAAPALDGIVTRQPQPA